EMHLRSIRNQRTAQFAQKAAVADEIRNDQKQAHDSGRRCWGEITGRRVIARRRGEATSVNSVGRFPHALESEVLERTTVTGAPKTRARRSVAQLAQRRSHGFRGPQFGEEA